jgi:hypothetical protein
MAVAAPGRPRSHINVRVDSAVKQRLEQQAAAEGLDLPNYLRKHYQELAQQGMIVPEENVSIPNPMGYPQTAPPGYVPPIMPPQQYGYPPPAYYYPPPQYATQPTGPDQLDIFVAEMRKLMLSQMMGKMMMDMQRGGATPEDVVRAYKGQEKDELSMQDIMKMQMVQAQIDKQYQQQMFQAQQQLENARNKGDKQGENQALQLLTALSTAQMQQQQNFMQQFMLAQQNAQATQQTLFTTALQTNRSSEDAARAERQIFQSQVENVRNDLFKTQLSGVESNNKLQVEYLKADLERIRNEKPKDVITQMGDLLNMRNTNPVYKAAFDAAFGIKDESGWASMIPKLKELGVDQVINKLTNVLGSVFVRPPSIPPPTAPAPIPAPMPVPTAEELQKLRLPQTGPVDLTQQQQPIIQEPGSERPGSERIRIERPDNVGYSNLESIEQGSQGEMVQIPNPEEPQSQTQPQQTQQETVQVPQNEQPTIAAGQPQTEEPHVVSPAEDSGKTWTTGRPRGSRNKPKPQPQP